MAGTERQYVSIDLKSFYASVECVEMGLDPFKTNLVVADKSRTEKTICLAVSPALKSYGIPGRARLFEVIQKVEEINALRRISAPNKKLTESSVFSDELAHNPSFKLDFITASPKMSLYMKKSAFIYGIYLKYFAPEDICVYSVDEVFIDVTNYLRTYKMTARELTVRIINDIYDTTGITATAGIGTNLYLCKVAMDIMAKKMPADENGARIAGLDEMSYRKKLWAHKPLTDFWRVGAGYAKKLNDLSVFTMGDIARLSLTNEDLLYKLFGVNAELLIDHAWGYEPCLMEDIKNYKPQTKSLSNGQVLSEPYTFEKALIVISEMAESLSYDLLDSGFLTRQIVIYIGYDTANISDIDRRKNYKGEIKTDRYGRLVPKHSQGTENLDVATASSQKIINSARHLFERIADKDLLIRRMSVCAAGIVSENEYTEPPVQLDIFSLSDQAEKADKSAAEKEIKMQKAILNIKKRYGKNAVLKGMNFREGATARSRNRQIGGHKA